MSDYLGTMVFRPLTENILSDEACERVDLIWMMGLIVLFSAMQTRRVPGTPMAVFLSHAPVARRTSSLLSVSTQGSPRTPRSCGSPSNSVFVPPPPNRKSTDSWNSSNADDVEWEWRQDQLVLLSRVTFLLLSPPLLLTLPDARCPPSPPCHSLQRSNPPLKSAGQNRPRRFSR